MVWAVFLLFCASVCATVFTVINSRCARYGANFNIVQGMNAMAMFLFSLVMAAFLHQYPDSLKNAMIVMAVHTLAGVSAFFSLVFLTLAMRTGHNGISVTVVNTKLLFPCVIGVMFLGDEVNARIVAVMALTILGIAIIGFKRTDAPSRYGNSDRRWFAMVIAALLCGGISGCLNVLLSYFPEVQAQPVFRTAGNCFGGFCCYLFSIKGIPQLDLKRLPTRREALYILAAFLVCIVESYVFTYNAFDRLAALKHAGIASPLIVGFTTVLFMAYSVCFNRERTSAASWVGFFCILGGLAILIWR